MTVKGHELTLHIAVPEWVPTHVNRKESAKYEHNRQTLIDDGHGYCFGCAIAGIHLPYHANGGLQCHHLSEWAEWPDADPNYVKILAQWLDPYGYSSKMGNHPIEDPDDIRLLLMLCETCHIGAPKDPSVVESEPTSYISGGIHYCSFVQWIADRVRVRKARAA